MYCTNLETYILLFFNALYKATLRRDPPFWTRSSEATNPNRLNCDRCKAADWSIDSKRNQQDRQPAHSCRYVVLHRTAGNNNREFRRRHGIFHAKANWIDFQDGLWSTGRHVSLCSSSLYGENHLFRKSQTPSAIHDAFCLAHRRSYPDKQNKNVNIFKSELARPLSVVYTAYTRCFVEKRNFHSLCVGTDLIIATSYASATYRPGTTRPFFKIAPHRS